MHLPWAGWTCAGPVIRVAVAEFRQFAARASKKIFSTPALSPFPNGRRNRPLVLRNASDALYCTNIFCRSLELTPGEEEIVIPQADVRVSNAALGEKLQDQDGRTAVKISYSKNDDDSEDEDEGEGEESIASFILCALTAGKVHTLHLLPSNH